jgi:carboxyl-terminal processing protease
MKRNYKLLLIVIFVSLSLLAFKSNYASTTDPEKDKLLIELLTFVLDKGHYSPASMDDEFSKGIYKDYIEALDPSKRFFLQSDIDEFSKYELELDDQIQNKDLTFFDLTYTRLMQRMEESKVIYKKVLGQSFDYSVDESFNTDYEKMPYAKNATELTERWRKQIKLSTLSSFVNSRK